MIDRINVLHIITAHFKTLRSLNNRSSNSIYWGDLILFIILPLIVAILLTYRNISIKSISGDLIKSVAIFAAFLFNMLAIIYNSLKDLSKDAETDQIKKIYIKEIHTNLSFNILVGIILIVLLVIQSTFSDNVSCIKAIIEDLLNILNYYFLILFVLTLLMNLNRVYILLNKQIVKENDS